MKASAVAATFAGPIAAHAASLAVEDVRQPVALGFFDEELGLANGFAAALSANGAETMAVGRDMTSLWLRAIRSTGPIIGLTRAGPLFCLQQMSPASGRIVHLYRALPDAEIVKLRGQSRDDFDKRLASLAFEALGRNAGPKRQGSQRGHVAALSSNDSGKLILWAASRTAIG